MIDRTNRNTALASALVEELGRCGVRHAVLSPGSRSSPLALALDREPGIELTMVLDERSAGFVALGAALASGTPAVVGCTSGSAAANLHPAVVEADLAGVPLLLLTSDRPPELRDVGAGQTIDQIKLYGSSVRWFCEVGTHEADDDGLLHLRGSACRAVGEATAGRGPVHLNLSWRDPLGPEPRPDDVTAADSLALGGRAPDRPLTMPVPGSTPSEALLEAAAEAFSAAERPLIVAGRTPDPEVACAVAGLAASLGAPLLADTTSQLRFGARGTPPVVAAYDLILREAPADLDPDLVIRFGDMPASKALQAWLGRTGGPDQIIVDPPGGWNEPTRRARAVLSADAAHLATDVAERMSASAPQAWSTRWAEAEERAQASIDAVLGEQDRLTEPGIARSLSGLPAAGDQLLLASSMPIRDAEAFTRGGAQAVRVFANRGANGIDGLISTAAGLTRGANAPAWIVLGDLALAHDLGGLAALRQSPRPVRVVLVDNGGGRIFEFLPQASQVDAARFEELFITPSQLEPERVAGLFGLDYVQVDSPGKLAVEADAPDTLLHVPVDPSGNVELHRRIAAQVAEAVGG
ncbi:MAG TPA: 2-succinyl-5-enolpyruvyl-6-hydroxy-3-cyclohexene-1-carboxylic-acid synthase [Solirubrobacterales bacterium]|nr:2-succinyl-5-enolpyruvyl-6-hydroxy-3-cyclohexene-1-carboxylic-acid synthase [Solirubrobacterales bacterium]